MRDRGKSWWLVAGILVGGAGALVAGFDRPWGIFLVAFSVVAVLYGLSGGRNS